MSDLQRLKKNERKRWIHEKRENIFQVSIIHRPECYLVAAAN